MRLPLHKRLLIGGSVATVMGIVGLPAEAQIFFNIPDNLATGSVDIFLTSGENATGVITNGSGTFSSPFSINANTTTIVTIPDNLRLVAANVISNNGFSIESAQPIAAYLIDTNTPAASNDITNLFPIQGLGNNYRIMAGTSGVVSNGSQLSLTATQNNTVVTITPSVNTTTGQLANVPFNVTLNKNQSIMYYAAGSGASADLTGTKVNSSQPIAVLAGHLCGNVPPNATACDHLIEQMPTTANLGTNFVVVPTKQRGNAPGDVLKILADVDGTQVTLNEGGTTTLFNLNAGEFRVLQSNNSINQLSSVTSNNPILLGQFMVGSEQTGVSGLGDPAFSLIPDQSQWLKNYIFNVPIGYQNDFLNIAGSLDAINNLKLDGISVNSSLFSPVVGTSLFGGLINITDGSHLIESTESFMLLGHGFDNSFASYFGVGGSRSSGGGVTPPPDPEPRDVPEPNSLWSLGLIAGLGLILKKKANV